MTLRNFFHCLFAICAFSVMKCLLRSFPYLWIELFVLLLLSFKDDLCILDQVLYMSFAQHFSQSVTTFSFSLQCFPQSRSLILIKSSVSFLFILCIMNLKFCCQII